MCSTDNCRAQSQARHERIAVRIFSDEQQAAKMVAGRIAGLIRDNNAIGKNTVLGLATGHAPVGVYDRLIKLHQEEGLDFSRVVTFNLDEYWPMPTDAVQSYHHWMHDRLFDHINIRPENIHIPAGDLAREKVAGHCRAYEEAIREAGGIDLQVLGIGRTGHIGFNEPGSGRDSRTRLVALDTVTLRDAASDFFGEENVPRHAITMGVATIMEAREICLLAFGEHKSTIVRRAVEEPPSLTVASSQLQEHGNATFYLDLAAAADLTRIATPWLVGSCVWDEKLKHQAVLWLATRLEKAILKLTDEDYAENGLAELLALAGGAYHLNLEIFRKQMKTITGWPGGKGVKRRALILSPHPDDDVICMGGTMARLVEQGHEVHVAYMVTGSLSVFDHDVARYADFVREFNTIFGLGPDDSVRIEQHIDSFLRQKSPGQIDSPEVQRIKGLIRKTEALDAAQYCGVEQANTHFLDLPFYHTGEAQKLDISNEDVQRVGELLERVRPDMVFAAGDLSDPHGTHRLCLLALLRALDDYESPSLPLELWLYRGAWQEWKLDQVDMAVPLSPDETLHKRFAIFRHQSQKDRAMFPGPFDRREFWQRAEERNCGTAALYDTLGLPEYHALEAFARYPLGQAAHLQAQLDSECAGQ